MGGAPVLRAGEPDHAVLGGTPARWPIQLGYNRVIAKPESTVGGAVPRDPLLVVGGAGKGRTVAFAPDFAPHWAPPEFVGWSHYDALWVSITSWASGERTGG